jgi:hypothetical protein
LRKVPPTLKVRTSFSIVASGATELSACASFAEVEMRRPEGEGEIERDGYRHFENVEGRPRLRFHQGRLWRFGYVSPHQRVAIGGKEKAQRYATDPEYRASLIARKAWEKAKGK